jgi:hypothetical protein
LASQTSSSFSILIPTAKIITMDPLGKRRHEHGKEKIET